MSPLDTNGCDFQVGSFSLQQQTTGLNKPVSYSSGHSRRQGTPTTLHTRCGSGSSHTAIKAIFGRGPIQIRSTHNALCWILNLIHTSGKLADCRLRLPEIGFYIVLRARGKHHATDALSRLLINGHDIIGMKDTSLVLKIVSVREAKDRKCDVKNCQILDEEIDKTALAIPTVSGLPNQLQQ